ncbi:hypothetical protein [Psychromonas sp.]
MGHLVKSHGVADRAEVTGLSRESLYKTKEPALITSNSSLLFKGYF